MEKLIKLFRSQPGMTEEQVEQSVNAFVRRSFKEKDFFVREGEICKQIGYVDKGCFSNYHLTASGKKSIVEFAFEDWWIGDLDSFFHKTPSVSYWQALEDAEVITISRNNFDRLYESVPAFAEIYRAKTNKAYMKSMERSAKDKVETAEEKYLRLQNTQPMILQRVPHYDVAAYLGIAPESLSRIRKKLAGK